MKATLLNEFKTKLNRRSFKCFLLHGLHEKQLLFIFWNFYSWLQLGRWVASWLSEIGWWNLAPPFPPTRLQCNNVTSRHVIVTWASRGAWAYWLCLRIPNNTRQWPFHIFFFLGSSISHSVLLSLLYQFLLTGTRGLKQRPHYATKMWKRAALLPRLCLSYTLIRHEYEAFRNRFSLRPEEF